MKTKSIGKFIIEQVLGQAIGYFVGLWAYLVVSEYFVARKASNLWGLFSKKQTVSKDEFEWLIFGVSYLLGLCAMLAVNYLISVMFPKKPDNQDVIT